MSERSLELVLADWREKASTADYLGHTKDAELIRKVVSEVEAASVEYVTWLSESEASLRSGRSNEWLRARFPEWEREGHARRDGRERRYRMLVIPRRADAAGAYQAGLKTA